MAENEFVQENLILGVGLTESIISAALATDHKASVNIEAGFNYSGAFMTLTIKELEKLIKEKKVYPQKDLPHKDLKIEFLEEGTADIDQFIEKYGFRGFNVDFNPRLIFSSGRATDMMIEAQIDNYITFRSLKGLYFADKLEGGKLETVPIDKGGIFKNKLFTLQEKKELFNFLNVAMRFFRKEEQMDEDNNSISDFKKNLYTEIHENIQGVAKQEDIMQRDFVEFMKSAGLNSPKMIRLISACMCNYRINPFNAKKSKFEDHSTKSMLARLTRFVDSMHIHSDLPYVYPIYGTGDITQICSRISAVYGGIFLLGTDFQITGSSYDAENGHEVNVIIGEEAKTIRAKNVFIGPEYRKLVHHFVHPEKEDLSANPTGAQNESQVQNDEINQNQDDKIKENSVEETDKMKYTAFICHFTMTHEDEDQYAPVFPLVCHLDVDPETNGPVKSHHPITALVLDHTCGTVPENFLLVYFNYYMDTTTSVDDAYLLTHFSTMLTVKFPGLSPLSPIVRISHHTVHQHSTFEHLLNHTTLVPDPDFDLDLENTFLKARDEILKGGEGKLFKREEEEALDRDDQKEEETVLRELENFSL